VVGVEDGVFPEPEGLVELEIEGDGGHGGIMGLRAQNSKMRKSKVGKCKAKAGPNGGSYRWTRMLTRTTGEPPMNADGRGPPRRRHWEWGGLAGVVGMGGLERRVSAELAFALLRGKRGGQE
jgi:hypothetical protein